MNIGRFLRTKREERGLTLKNVADAVGVSQATVSRWESGDIKNMRRDRIETLAHMLGISPLTIVMSEDDNIYIPHRQTETDIIGSEDETRSELLRAIASLPTEKLMAIVQLFK